ncbi:MAG: tetratricopeptide repeat protein [Thermoanaerobaculia bacterium]
MKRGIFCSALAVLALLALPARAAIDPFYLNLLRDGQHALDRKDFREAARDFRLACFGMLDEPRMLTDCLARLALAQDAAGDVEGFRDTFQRLVELEDRFKAYSQADLAPELRAALEARLASRLPAATLEGAPAFRSTLGKKGAAAPPAGSSQKPSASPPTGAASPPAAPVVKPPAAAPAKAPEKLPQKTPEKAPEKTPEKATTAPPPSPQPASPKPLTDAERQKLERARSALTQHGAPKDVLRDAFQAAREVADAHPDSREAQHLAAEAAYRISRWPDAATYFRRGGDPGDGEPERLFYQAVSLFESGDPAGAAASLRRALPGLKRTPYVESYMKKILGGAP